MMTDPTPVGLPPEPPKSFITEQREIWKRLARPDHTPADAVLLEQAVQWLLLSRRLLTLAQDDPSPATVNAAVTSGTMIIRLSEKLGLSNADRKAIGVVAVKPAPQPRKKRALDDLTPEKLGILPYRSPGADNLPAEVNLNAAQSGSMCNDSVLKTSRTKGSQS